MMTRDRQHLRIALVVQDGRLRLPGSEREKRFDELVRLFPRVQPRDPLAYVARAPRRFPPPGHHGAANAGEPEWPHQVHVADHTSERPRPGPLTDSYTCAGQRTRRHGGHLTPD